jgi:hypothetical protein
MDRIVADEHELANHTTLDTASWRLGPEVFETSLLLCETVIQRWKSKSRTEGDNGVSVSVSA